MLVNVHPIDHRAGGGQEDRILHERSDETTCILLGNLTKDSFVLFLTFLCVGELNDQGLEFFQHCLLSAIFIRSLLQSCRKVLFLVRAFIFQDLIDKNILVVQVGVYRQQIRQDKFLFELVLGHHFAVISETGRVDQCSQHVVEKWYCRSEECLSMESLGTPVRQIPQKFEIADRLLQVPSHSSRIHFFTTLVLSCHGVICSFQIVLLELFILVGDLIEAIRGIRHDHIDESLELFCAAQLAQSPAVDIMPPECHEYLVGVEPVFVLAVERMGMASEGDITIELHQTDSNVFHCDLILLQDFTDQVLLDRDEVEDDFDEVCADVRVTTGAILRQ